MNYYFYWKCVKYGLIEKYNTKHPTEFTYTNPDHGGTDVHHRLKWIHVTKSVYIVIDRLATYEQPNTVFPFIHGDFYIVQSENAKEMLPSFPQTDQQVISFLQNITQWMQNYGDPHFDL